MVELKLKLPFTTRPWVQKQYKDCEC